MSFTIGMHERSLAHIGGRLDALGLDASVLAFGSDGYFHVDGGQVSPEAVDIDYMWLSSHIAAGPAEQRQALKDAAFDLVLACRSVGVLQTFNAGLDDPFYRKAAAKGMRICNSSAQGVAIAEYVMAQVCGLLHPIAQQREQQHSRVWRTTPFREISRTRWLIVGFGPIGQAVAHRAKAFGAHVTVVRQSPEPHEDADRVGTPADLPAFLPDADIVLLACPLNDHTRGLAGTAFFDRVKPGAILLNIARGGVVDDEALIAALDAERLDCAVLDVFDIEPLPSDDPLWRHPKVRLTSHTSFAGDGVQDRWDALFLDNVRHYAAGEPLIREIDPSVI